MLQTGSKSISVNIRDVNNLNVYLMISVAPPPPLIKHKMLTQCCLKVVPTLSGCRRWYNIWCSAILFPSKMRKLFILNSPPLLYVKEFRMVLFGYFRPLGYERVYLPLCKVADTPFHIRGDDLSTWWVYAGAVYKPVVSFDDRWPQHYLPD